jgi:hypothetical protein
MNAIFKVNNVYVTVMHKDVKEDIEFENLNDLIISTEGKTSVTLYGGRVYIYKTTRNYNTYFGFMINGIDIYDIDIDFCKVNEDNAHCIGEITAYLNQIEHFGLEGFLNNYKKQLENLKDKIEVIYSEMQQNSDINAEGERLNGIRRTLIKLNSFLFPLCVNMNTGIGMQDYEDAYNTVVNKYF